MKCFKKIKVLLFTVCLMVAFSACSNGDGEYESLSSFEYHFFPEEYEKEYSETTNKVQLESGKNYKFLITSECEDGSIKITATYSGTDDTTYLVNSASPCNEWIELPAGTAECITFMFNIEAETDGFVIVETFIK